MKKFNPYDKYAGTNEVTTSLIIEDWNCELVEPKHPALSRPATTDPFSSDIDWESREKEMIELMHHNLGIGLAAPQVGSNYNMFVMQHSILGNIGIYKPKILETESEITLEEGCLSFPLLFLPVTRAEKIKVTYYKTDGETQVETWMDGRDARCFLHEYDHLQGTLFIDLVSDLKLTRAFKKREKLFKKIEN